MLVEQWPDDYAIFATRGYTTDEALARSSYISVSYWLKTYHLQCFGRAVLCDFLVDCHRPSTVITES